MFMVSREVNSFAYQLKRIFYELVTGWQNHFNEYTFSINTWFRNTMLWVILFFQTALLLKLSKYFNLDYLPYLMIVFFSNSARLNKISTKALKRLGCNSTVFCRRCVSFILSPASVKFAFSELRSKCSFYFKHEQRTI